MKPLGSDPWRVRRRGFDGARAFYGIVAALFAFPAVFGGLLWTLGRRMPHGAKSVVLGSAVVALLAAAAFCRAERAPRTASLLGLFSVALAAGGMVRSVAVDLIRSQRAFEAMDWIFLAAFAATIAFALRAALRFRAAAASLPESSERS
jgi:hypothetical protein